MNVYQQYEKQIIEEFERHGNIAEYGHLKDLLKKVLDEFNIDEVRRLIKNELKDYDFSFLKHLYSQKFKGVASNNEKYESFDDKDAEGLKFYMLANKGLELMKIDMKLNFIYAKEIMQELYESHENKMFIISKSHKLHGRVVFQKFYTKKHVSLIQEYESLKDKKRYIMFIGDKFPNKQAIYHNSQPFYFHEFECNGEKYELLYDQPIKPQDCTIEGMVINMNDDIKLGESLKVSEAHKLLIAHTVIEDLKELTPPEVKEICKGWDREVLAEKMFGKLRAPKMVETLKLAFTFSGKAGGYPLHLIVMGPNGTGKTLSYLTTTSMNVPGTFGPKGFIDGSGTTLLGLIPSYSSSKAAPGLFVESTRICYIDEFFKVMSRSGFSIQGGRVHGLEPFAGLLEHREKSQYGSGNTESANFVASAKALFVTNPEKGLESLDQIVSALSTPSMARFLIYQQTKEEINWIENHIHEIMSMREGDYLPATDKNFVNLFDYFYKRVIVVDYNKLKAIRERLKELVPASLQDMFRTRYFHHVACVVDGISNIRFLCNEKKSLEYDDEDYVEAEALMHYVVSSWSDGFNIEKVDVDKRYLYLHKKEMDLYTEVCRENGDLLEVDVEDTDSLKKLLDYKIVYSKKGYLLPYYNPDVWNSKGVTIDI